MSKGGNQHGDPKHKPNMLQTAFRSQNTKTEADKRDSSQLIKLQSGQWAILDVSMDRDTESGHHIVQHNLSHVSVMATLQSTDSISH